MKVTKREKVLLGVLFIILLGYVFYKFIYTEQNNKINELKANRDMYSQKWEQVKAKIASKDTKDEQHKILNAKILDKTDKLFTLIEQEKIIVILDKMLKSSKLQGDVLGFSEISIESASENTSKTESNSEKVSDSNLESNNSNANNGSGSSNDNNNSNTRTDISKAISAYKMQVTLNFKGNYNELISFIKQVESYDKKIIINNVNLAGAQGSDVVGSILLEFYGIPKLNNNDYFKWDYKKPNGKGNPFSGGSSVAVVDNEKTSNINVAGKNISSFDFEMTAKPSSSDLPTVILGKSKDRNRNTYVYGDNDGVEEVNVNLVENSGKYFFKYKTSSNSYPENSIIGEEFLPTGDSINLIVYSTKRNSKEDLSGVNLKIFNNTSKKVFVKILGDDKERPRVNVIPEKGEVNQER